MNSVNERGEGMELRMIQTLGWNEKTSIENIEGLFLDGVGDAVSWVSCSFLQGRVVPSFRGALFLPSWARSSFFQWQVVPSFRGKFFPSFFGGMFLQEWDVPPSGICFSSFSSGLFHCWRVAVLYFSYIIILLL